MLPPDFWDYAADDILELYTALDDAIIRDIARRLVKTGNVSATAEWQIRQAQESGLLYDSIISEIAKCTDASEAQVRTLFEEAGIQSVKIDSEIYSAAGLSPFPLAMAPAAMQVLQANVEKTSGHLRNLTMTTASQAQQAFIQASTLAEMQVESGAFDYATAIRSAVRKVGQSGSWVQYPTGHRDRLDVAVRRAVLTGVSQTTGQIALAYARDMGCDLMEISAHAGARPSHAEWQGKVVSLSGRMGYLSLSDIGYGTGDGFKGWNCRHDWYPFFEGLSTAAYPRNVLDEYNSRTVEYDGKTMSYYDATQRQREMERRIRDTKRTLAGYDEAIKESSGGLKAGLKADFDTTSAKLKRQEAALSDFLHQTGLRRDATRVWASEFGRSQAQKAVWGAKRVEKAARSGILSEEDVYSLYQYMSGKSYLINYAIRNKQPLSPEDQQLVRAIDQAIEKLPEHHGTVYRSLSSEMMENAKDFFSQHSPGKVVRYQAFTSASTSVYDSSFDIQLIIKSKHGRDMRKYNPREQEIIFARGSLFRVLKREGRTIWLTEI